MVLPWRSPTEPWRLQVRDFYRLCVIPVSQATVSKHWRETVDNNISCKATKNCDQTYRQRTRAQEYSRQRLDKSYFALLLFGSLDTRYHAVFRRLRWRWNAHDIISDIYNSDKMVVPCDVDTAFLSVRSFVQYRYCVETVTHVVKRFHTW